jgi:hypothetical protein
MRLFLYTFIFFSFAFHANAQTLHNPQELYDLPGGLYEKDSLRQLYVDFVDPNYHEVLVDAFFNNPSLRIDATVSLNGMSYDSAGVRYKGNSTFCLPNDALSQKVPFNIDMNYWVGGQKLLDYKKIKLANAWLDPTFVKEFSAAKVYRNYLPTPEVNLMELHVQGEYLGVYVNTESVNKQFLQKHFGENSGPLFKCDPAQVFCGENSGSGEPTLAWLGSDSAAYYNSYQRKSEHGWDELMELTNTLNFDFENLDEILNIDRVLWAFAVNTVILNLDTYNGYYVHNYYLYRTEDGLFQMIPWDLSESYVGALLGWDFSDPTPLYEFDPYFAPAERPLANLLLNDPAYRKQYTAHVRTVMEEILQSDELETLIESQQELAYNSVEADENKLFNMTSYASNVDAPYFSSEIFWGIGGIIESNVERETFLSSYPEIANIPPSIDEVISSDDYITAEVTGADEVVLMATASEYNSKFQSFLMHDDGLNGDQNANDGIYTADTPFQGNELGVKFYIKAQNADAVMLSPERAEYEFYKHGVPTYVSELDINPNRKLVKITDIQGREVGDHHDGFLLYIYDDGSVERKVVID